MTLDSYALNFQEAWDAAKAAEQTHTRVAAQSGDCKHYNVDDLTGIRCYRSGRPPEKWCKACRTRQPAWQDARAKRYIATAAMKTLLNAARKAGKEAA